MEVIRVLIRETTLRPVALPPTASGEIKSYITGLGRKPSPLS